MVYRKSLDDKWHCSWNFGFMYEDFAKVVERENKEHCGAKRE
jgi:hypothetical protein